MTPSLSPPLFFSFYSFFRVFRRGKEREKKKAKGRTGKGERKERKMREKTFLVLPLSPPIGVSKNEKTRISNLL